MKCEHCQKETRISFEDWHELTSVMLNFVSLTKEQKDMILLMVDGALYRQEKQNKWAHIPIQAGSEEK